MLKLIKAFFDDFLVYKQILTLLVQLTFNWLTGEWGPGPQFCLFCFFQLDSLSSIIYQDLRRG